MQGAYGSGKICPFDNQNCDLATEGLTLEPSLEAILTDVENHSWSELEYVWKGWRDASGKKYRDQYTQYIGLNNEAAEANGKNFSSTSKHWDGIGSIFAREIFYARANLN